MARAIMTKFLTTTFVLWISFMTIHAWAIVVYNKKTAGRIPEVNPQALEQGNKFVRVNNAVLAVAEQRPLQAVPEPKLNQWFGDVSTPIDKETYQRFIETDNGRYFKEISYEEFIKNSNTESDKQLLLRALELANQKIPDRVKTWVSSVQHIIITDMPLPAMAVGELGIVLINRSHLSNHLLKDETPEMRLVVGIAHEAKHVWQFQKGLYQSEYGEDDYKQHVKAEKDAHIEAYMVMQTLGYPKGTVGVQKWLAENIDTGNDMIDRFVTGDASQEEQEKIMHKLEAVRKQILSGKTPKRRHNR